MNPSAARELFDRNAARYHPVNTVLSVGLDRRWRRWVAVKAVRRPGARVLDAMTGTGEVAVEAALLGARVTAVDISTEMLSHARNRARDAGVCVSPVVADLTARRSPLPKSYDAACISFGLRYVDDQHALLRSLAGRLCPGGRIVVLEFCVPPRRPLSSAASLYFFNILPALGGAFGVGRELYDYLGASTRRIGTAENIERIIGGAGLIVIERASFGFGLVAGFVAVRSADAAAGLIQPLRQA